MVWPASRSASSSPTQTIGISPAASAARTFLLIAGVGLAQDVPALAVAEDHVLAAQVAEHGRAQFAGERPVVLVIHVLGAQGDFRAGEGPAHGIQIAAWRADGQIDAVDGPRPVSATPSANATAAARFEVHLPVAGNKRTSHRISLPFFIVK